MAEDTNVALNLDALAPKKVQIEFEGKLINVEPPTVEQYAIIIHLSEEMAATENKTDKMTAVYTKVKELIGQVTPEFKGKNFNYMQLTAIFKLLTELGSPSTDEAMAELERRGIKINAQGNQSPKDSTSPKPSADSLPTTQATQPEAPSKNTP